MIKKSNSLLALLFIVVQSYGFAQTTSKKELFNKDFNWTISIPEDFENVPAADWDKLQNKGAEAVEKTYDQQVVNRATTIFVFRNDQMNYFESNYQPFDEKVDGNYLESCKNVNGILYETFQTQMPDVKIDSSTTVEKIDGLEFQVSLMKITYPNGIVLNSVMYSRLFDKRELSINMMYLNETKGREMLSALRKSKFKR